MTNPEIAMQNFLCEMNLTVRNIYIGHIQWRMGRFVVYQKFGTQLRFFQLVSWSVHDVDDDNEFRTKAASKAAIAAP